MIGVADIMAAMSAWELVEWGSLTPPLQTFQYFPTKDQWGPGGLEYPYSCHQRENTDALKVTINSTPQTEDYQVHLIWVYVMFCREGDPFHIWSQLDAEWTDRYRVGFLKHLRHDIPPPTGGAIRVNEMGTDQPSKLRMFGRRDMGIMVPVTVGIRQLMTVGK